MERQRKARPKLDLRRWLPVSDAASTYGLSRSIIHSWITDGRIEVRLIRSPHNQVQIRGVDRQQVARLAAATRRHSTGVKDSNRTIQWRTIAVTTDERAELERLRDERRDRQGEPRQTSLRSFILDAARSLVAATPPRRRARPRPRAASEPLAPPHPL